ncbi:MAG: hypothetical protein M1459_02765 [Patescibacteria group bacterium]|nr:hypothetical protein [Patescibacteria group bacterium]
MATIRDNALSGAVVVAGLAVLLGATYFVASALNSNSSADEILRNASLRTKPDAPRTAQEISSDLLAARASLQTETLRLNDMSATRSFNLALDAAKRTVAIVDEPVINNDSAIKAKVESVRNSLKKTINEWKQFADAKPVLTDPKNVAKIKEYVNEVNNIVNELKDISKSIDSTDVSVEEATNIKTSIDQAISGAEEAVSTIENITSNTDTSVDQSGSGVTADNSNTGSTTNTSSSSDTDTSYTDINNIPPSDNISATDISDQANVVSNVTDNVNDLQQELNNVNNTSTDTSSTTTSSDVPTDASGIPLPPPKINSPTKPELIEGTNDI